MEWLRPLLRQIRDGTEGSPGWIKLLIVIVMIAIVLFVIYSAPFVNKIPEYFAKASSTAQSFVLMLLLLMAIAGVIFALERSRRSDNLKAENQRLKHDLNEAERRAAAAEERWQKLCDVETRHNYWKMTSISQPPKFVDRSNRGSATRFVSFVNLKGGVGKTTLTANLAVLLGTNSSAKRVLVIDIDFQGTLSEMCLSPEMYSLQTKNGNVVNRLLEEELLTESDLTKLMMPIDGAPSVKIIPSNDTLETEDQRLQSEYFVERSREPRFRFRENLHRNVIFHQFDFVFFDCPPRLTTATFNALAASDYVVIPTNLDNGSVNAVPRTLHWLDQLSALAPPPKLMGVIVSQAAVRSGKLTQMENARYNNLREKVATRFAGNQGFVFESWVKEDTKIVMGGARGVLPGLDPQSCDLFAPVATEFLRKVLA